MAREGWLKVEHVRPITAVAALISLIIVLVAGPANSEQLPQARVVSASEANDDRITTPTAEYHGPSTTEAPTTTTTTLTSQTTAPAEPTLDTVTPPTTLAPTTTTTSTTSLPTTTASSVDIARARGEEALALLSYDWQNRLVGWEISFHPGRSGVLGYTFVNEKRIEVYVRESQSAPLLAHVVAHELGHAVDVSLNSGDDRRLWQEARGIGASPWWPGSGVTDFSTGAGDFAESFAAWQVGTGSYRSKLSSPPTVEQLTLMAELSAG